MSVLKMKEQDLLELYQMCAVYVRTYGGKAAVELKEEVAQRYREQSGGKEISGAGNPRGAGRRRIYPETTNEKIMQLHSRGMSKRRIAKEIGCSLGHVQDVVREQGQSELQVYGN